VYAYEFVHQPSFDFWTDVPQCNVPGQVCHGVELPFVFGNPNAALAFDSERMFTPAEDRLAGTMMRYWLGLTESGNDPNAGGGPAWPLFDDSDELRQVLDLEVSQEAGFAASNCVNLWDRIGYDLGEIHDDVFAAAASPG
jgi:carboxylesterase type B